jgi:hypothetical protein
LVGIVTLNNEVLQDDVDQAFGFTFLTPALVREAAAVSPDPITPTLYGLKLDHGNRGVAKVERELVRLVPPGYTYEFHATSSIVEQMELSLKPESVALGVFGTIAALVCLVLGLQAISRQLGPADEDRAVLRALGAGPAVIVADGLIGVLAAVVLGSLLADAVAIGLSPGSPIGPVRPVYPDPGIAVDWGCSAPDLRFWSSALGWPQPRCRTGGHPTRWPVTNGVRFAVRASAAAPKRRPCR